jgi:hypothetical protein
MSKSCKPYNNRLPATRKQLRRLEQATEPLKRSAEASERMVEAAERFAEAPEGSEAQS